MNSLDKVEIDNSLYQSVHFQPTTTTVWNNLGSAWYNLGQHEKAIEYYEKALASGLKTYGKEHPHVATCSGLVKVDT